MVSTPSSDHLKINPNLFIIHFVLLLGLTQHRSCQTFIHDCNDPNILNHMPDFDHSYCAHACRPNLENDAVCAPSGTCQCHLPCYNDPANAVMTLPIVNDLCPPIATDPVDPNIVALRAACIAGCPTACPGGTGGTICGESDAFDDNNGDATIFTTICACQCPAQPCTPVTTTTTTTTTTTPATTTTTTTTPATTTTTTTPVTTTTTTTPATTTTTTPATTTTTLAMSPAVIQFVRPSRELLFIRVITIMKIILIWIWDAYKAYWYSLCFHLYLECVKGLFNFYIDFGIHELNYDVEDNNDISVDDEDDHDVTFGNVPLLDEK